MDSPSKTPSKDEDGMEALADKLGRLATGPRTPASQVKRPTHAASAWSGGFKPLHEPAPDDLREKKRRLDSSLLTAASIVEGGSLKKTSRARGSKVRELHGGDLLYHAHLLLALGNWRFKLDDDKLMPREGKKAIQLAHSLHNK